MNKILKISVLFSVLFSVSAGVHAGTVNNVTLTSVGCETGSTICFANVDKDVGDGTCANLRQVRWDGGTSAGKAITAAMLTAKASGSTVVIGFFDGQCFAGGTNFPDLNFVSVN